MVNFNNATHLIDGIKADKRLLDILENHRANYNRVNVQCTNLDRRMLLELLGRKRYCLTSRSEERETEYGH